MREEWRVIASFDDYEISNLGRIRRIRFGGGLRKNTWKPGRMKKISFNGNGYQRVILYRNRKGKSCYIHRLVLETFVGPAPFRNECNHKDGNKENNKLSNLEWVTHSENEKHAYANGLVVSKGAPGRFGEAHPLHHLRDGEVYLIKLLLISRKISHKIIAKMFRVTGSTISKINRGIRWSHIECSIRTTPIVKPGLCQCGCGCKLKPSRPSRSRRFLRGHNTRITIRPERQEKNGRVYENPRSRFLEEIR